MAEVDLQAISDEIPLHRNLGLRISRSEGGIALEAAVGPDFIVDPARGSVHGGIVATLLDAAATFALMAETRQDWVTVDLRVDYLRPLSAGSVVTTGEVVRAGRSVGRARATVADAAGTVCAVAIGTFAPGAELTGKS